MISQQSQLQSLRYVHYFIFLCIQLFRKYICLWKRKTKETYFSFQNGDSVNNGEHDTVSDFPHMRKKLWIGKKDDECCPVLGREIISFSL